MHRFPKNIGPRDRIIRTILGISIATIALYLPLSTGWTAILFALAGIQLITAAASYCPLYSLLGRSTSKTTDKK